MELTENSTASLPNFPEPLQPGEIVATKIWHYKHNNAALFGNVKACNTIFKYDSNPGGVGLAANKQT
jgi:hypothetical protein